MALPIRIAFELDKYSPKNPPTKAPTGAIKVEIPTIAPIAEPIFSLGASIWTMV